uniref:G-protein coupled receptors family 1 profile domain-containing protein n=1 Tax=Panagrolaimus davidi TaxID=227884 RepID=A0A914P178_9BILA
MPYAVLVYVQGGYWFLGNLMCDIYSASDVACSTASILLLAVISFDRYRAVSRPIQYSRQSQNIQRVVFILIAIWLISILLASPIVFGINYRPPDANPYECRFYNPEFSIMSSFVSFVIPCFIVLFVYIRIMMALRKREKAAKARRNANSHTDGEKKGDLLDDEAGQIVAGPAVNVMMLALPSMTRRIRRYERHKAAVENAGEEEEEIEEDEEVLEEEGCGVQGFSGDEGEDEDDEYEGDDSEYDNDVDSEDEDLHGSGITDESAVDSGIDGEKKKKHHLVKGHRHRKRRITSSGADSLVAAAIATKNGKNKTNVTPQALCLSSFLPILGTATANVGRPRRRSATAIRKPELQKFKPFEPLSLPSTSRTPFDNDNDSDNNIVKTSLTIDPCSPLPLFLIEKNLSDQQLTTKHLRQQLIQTRANFFRSKSGPPMLDSKSPLMLRRFMLDPDNDPISIQTLDVQKLNSASAMKEPILTPRSGSVKKST